MEDSTNSVDYRSGALRTLASLETVNARCSHKERKIHPQREAGLSLMFSGHESNRAHTMVDRPREN